MPELDWVGKRHVVGHADKVPFRSLRRVPASSFGDVDEVGASNEKDQSGANLIDSGNVIVRGDNLQALKALLPFYRGRVKLVFIDPPYNADGEVWSYDDRIDAPYIERWLGSVEADDPLRQDKWLCMMYPRLALLREFLKPNGTIFITIGDNEVHHLRMLLDEVFGVRNFLGCAVWEKGLSGDGGGEIIASTHNYVVIYARDRSQASLDGPDATTWWTGKGFGDSRTAKRELGGLFPEVKDLFAIPKPTRLIQHILELATEPVACDIVLDCFAGSGTTAHAVLNQNALDGGDRRFLLVETEDYADTLTAERVRRVIRGKSGQPRTHPKSGFDYYELGEERLTESEDR
ncbi:MAG: site-specific DNA-methyltransferase [Actinomycetota bacterium]|nr:site-specific DNA-methyltransferase [Actinomycetota bacterium]